MHALLLALVLAAPIRGSDHAGRAGYGLGVILGEPTGVSLKRYLPGGGWDAYVGFAYGPGVRFGFDWLWTLGNIARGQDVYLDGYVGVGPFLGTFAGQCNGGFINNTCNGDFYFGGRVPFGVEAIFRRAPVSLAVEIAPALGIVPAAPARAGLLLDVLLAIRFLF
jgi:hypothetical protein